MRVWVRALTVVSVLLILVALAIGAVLVWVLPEHIGRVTFDGRTVDLTHAHGGHWLLASLLVLVAMLLAMVIALVATAVPLIGSVLALAVVLLLLGLVLSPVLVLGWWLWKRSSADRTNKATMPP
jgi:hypothetical protein